MHIIVTVKQVPDPEAPQSSFTVDRAAKKVVVASSVPSTVSDMDVYATEAALLVKDVVPDTTVSVLSLGDSHVMDVVKRPLAMGADALYLVQDAELAGGDAMAIAHALAAAIRKIGPFDLIMAGRQSADLDQGIVATGVAMLLGVPVMTNAVRVAMNGDAIQIDRIVDDGIDTIEAKLPAVVTVSNELGQPRYATMRGIMAARRVDPTVWSRADLETLESSEALTTPVDLFEPEKSSNVEIIEGENAADAGRLLAQRLRTERLI
ncbi:MAG: electron transfer flavoprotein subunit beta/FixA family protein [Dehalococcoidia bacterium]|jgi:electron transfer flavoprotein beta subunit|nr:electron transfer flavoprotein subunit beta/FixA family protein [Dehalococcoidia bacterium]